MSDTTQNNIVWGCPKHQGPLLGATLHRRNGPGQSCKLVDNAHTITSQTHLFDARVPHNILCAQCSAYNRTHLAARTHQIHPGSWAGSTELASNRIRSATGSTLFATHERPTSGSSPKHATLACGPPPSRKTCLQCAFFYQSPSSGALSPEANLVSHPRWMPSSLTTDKQCLGPKKGSTISFSTSRNFRFR
jgi:hypothetical protein